MDTWKYGSNDFAVKKNESEGKQWWRNMGKEW